MVILKCGRKLFKIKGIFPEIIQVRIPQEQSIITERLLQFFAKDTLLGAKTQRYQNVGFYIFFVLVPIA